MSSSVGDPGAFEPPAPGAAPPPDLAEPLPPAAPPPGVPGALRPESLQPGRAERADQQFPPPRAPAPEQSEPARPDRPDQPGRPDRRARRRWVAPVVGGIALLLVLCGVTTIVLFMKAQQRIDSAAGPLTSAPLSTPAVPQPGAPVSALPGTGRGAAAGPTGAVSPAGSGSSNGPRR